MLKKQGPSLGWVVRSFICLILWQIGFYTQISVQARKHHMEVLTDGRPYVALSTFGFYTKGQLDVKISQLNIDNEQENDIYGLTLDKTTIDAMNPYLDTHQTKCLLEENIETLQGTGPILFLIFDFKNLKVKVLCSQDWTNMQIYPKRTFRRKRQSLGDSALFLQPRRRRAAAPPPLDAARGDSPTYDEAKYPPDDDPVQPPLGKDDKSSTPLSVLHASEVNGSNTAKFIDNAAADQSPKIAENGKSNLVQEPALAETNKALSSENSSRDSERLKVKAASHEDSHEESRLNSNTNNNNNYRYPQESDDSSTSQEDVENGIKTKCSDIILPITKTVIDGRNYYNITLHMRIRNKHDEGLYNVYFHACPNYNTPKQVTFNADIEERNSDNYLSAGEMPLPPLYFMMSLLFFLSGLFWVFILRKSKHNVYKIHYLMAVLVFLKSLSLMFHSINFHYIDTLGEHIEAWAILYYIAHLLKGAVLFITIVLIGTGWTFIKGILSEKDKKIFMIVIPLQVLANVAEIIIDESEESDIEFRTWRNIFIFVDLLCCGAILFPIVWSIRHLHEASATDGKAAMNLRKLRLFRQFYIMIVCYIYFTRIIVYLLKMTEAFQYAWLHEMFREMITYVFFVLTGYKFRPSSSDLYFVVADDIDDDDEVEVLTESGLTQGLHRTKALNRSAPPPKTVIIEGNDEEKENLITKMESSHEYD